MGATVMSPKVSETTVDSEYGAETGIQNIELRT
jgi:hypothetical protein